MKSSSYLLLAAVTAGFVFATDLTIPLGVAWGVLYIIAVLIALQTPYNHVVIIIAAISTVLILLGLLFSPEVGEDWKVYINRAIAIFAIWIFALQGLIKNKKEKLLSKSGARLNEAQRIAELGNWELDLVSNSLRWSDEVFRIFNLEPQSSDVTYETFFNNVHPDYKAYVKKVYNDSIKNKTSYEITYRLLLKDGTIKFVNEHCNTFYDGVGRAVRSVGIIQDITKLKQAEEAVRESETKFRNLVEGSLQGIFVHRDFVPLFANQKCADIFGYENPEEILEQDSILVAFCALEEHERIRSYKIQRMKGSDAPTTYECLGRHKDGSLFWFENHVTIIEWEGERAVLATIIDITQRKQAEKRIEDSSQKYRKLAMRLENIREEERTLISHNIHDEFGQALTIMRMDLFWLKEKLSHSEKVIQNKIKSMISLIDSSINTVRKISSSLRPIILDDLGLEAAIEWYCNETNKRSGIAYNISGHVPDNIQGDTKTTLFRIFQEAVTNVIRHSGADEFNVELKHTKHYLCMTIYDNGIGIDKDTITTLGILGMKERAYQRGGSIKIENLETGGVQVTICLPIDGDGQGSTS
jgi:PAS domain S-box-containing protein